MTLELRPDLIRVSCTSILRLLGADQHRELPDRIQDREIRQFWPNSSGSTRKRLKDSLFGLGLLDTEMQPTEFLRSLWGGLNSPLWAEAVRQYLGAVAPSAYADDVLYSDELRAYLIAKSLPSDTVSRTIVLIEELAGSAGVHVSQEDAGSTTDRPSHASDKSLTMDRTKAEHPVAETSAVEKEHPFVTLRVTFETFGALSADELHAFQVLLRALPPRCVTLAKRD